MSGNTKEILDEIDSLFAEFNLSEELALTREDIATKSGNSFIHNKIRFNKLAEKLRLDVKELKGKTKKDLRILAEKVSNKPESNIENTKDKEKESELTEENSLPPNKLKMSIITTIDEALTRIKDYRKNGQLP
jgi:hypothetical protein